MREDGKVPEKVKRKMGKSWRKVEMLSLGEEVFREEACQWYGGLHRCQAGQRSKLHHLQPLDLEVGSRELLSRSISPQWGRGRWYLMEAGLRRDDMEGGISGPLAQDCQG